jgi:hypothetical protein
VRLLSGSRGTCLSVSSMPDSPFEEIGRHDRPGPYTDVEHLKCVVCGAGVMQKCVNPVTGKTRQIPCIGRKERRPA